jgi:hypothetical protein
VVDAGGVLERDIAIQCVLGREKLIRACHAILKNWIGEKFFFQSNSCYSRSTCACDRAKIIRRLKLFENEEDSQYEDDSQNEDDCHPFLNPWYAELDFQLCKSCLPAMKLAYKSACEELWSQVPGFFGLEHWDELKDFDM